MERTELAIVGAGPAGMEAALTAAGAGVDVTVIDSYPRPGGQYSKQLPEAFSSGDPSSRIDFTPHQRKAWEQVERFERADVRLLTNTLVWGAFPASDGGGWLLTLYGPGAPHRLAAQAVILATGAYDRPIAFPGWTMPGVLTAGAAQTLLKSQRVLPGRRILLSGTGPLQLAVAALLARYGATVVGVLEGAPLRWRAARAALALWGHWARLQEGWDYGRTLSQIGVPIHRGWSVVEARGDGAVQEAVIARLDDNWRPIPGSQRVVALDTLVIGYGLLPSTELGRLLGCQHQYKPERGGYVPRRDAEMQTTLPGVYAVGDGAGIGGAELACVEGHIAAWAAARRLGKVGEGVAREAIARQGSALARERRFARMLGDLFTPGPGLYSLAVESTVICRCEEVRLSQIREAVAGGARTVNEVKGLTRAGMGNCQARFCSELVARAVADQVSALDSGVWDMQSVGVFTPRPPLHPVPLSYLVAGAEGTAKLVGKPRE